LGIHILNTNAFIGNFLVAAYSVVYCLKQQLVKSIATLLSKLRWVRIYKGKNCYYFL